MTGKTRGRKPAKTPKKRKSKVKKARQEFNLRPMLQRSWWVLRGAMAGALVVVLLYGTWVGVEAAIRMPSLSVKIIKVEGCSEVEAGKVLELSEVSKGSPLLKVNLEQVRRRIIKHPAILDAVVVRRLPDTLLIEVTERRSLAVIIGPRGYARVDDQGVVIAWSARYPAGYPLISGNEQDVKPGRIAGGAVPAIEAITALSGSGLLGADRISEVWSDGSSVYVSLVNTGTLLVMSSTELKENIERLGRLMETSLFDVQAAGYDLRFDGRVVKLPERTDGGA
jgi:cell division protein FtsQ